MSEIQAKARVQITVEVDAGQPWGVDCSIGQLYKQAADTARDAVLRAIVAARGEANIKIIGEPKVIGIITEKP